MARKTLTTFHDDLDPTREATRTIPFSFDGKDYEIDLDDPHYDEMQARFYAYTVAGREVKKAAPKKKARRTSPKRSAEIRAFAKARGLKCQERGRIPGHIIAEFEAAQS